MNRFKEDVLREIKDVKLTDQKKREIAKKARMKGKVKRSGGWQYQIALVTFTLCAIAFSYLFTQDDGQRMGSHQGAAIQKDVDSSLIWTFLEFDLVKVFLLFVIHFGITFLIKYILKKRNYGLPVCIQCGEIFSHKQARNLFWKNNVKPIVCSHCGKKQYRTNRSMQLNLAITIPITSTLALSNTFFDNFWMGIGLYLVCFFMYHYQLGSYLFVLQENDPMKEHQKPLW